MFSIFSRFIVFLVIENQKCTDIQQWIDPYILTFSPEMSPGGTVVQSSTVAAQFPLVQSVANHSAGGGGASVGGGNPVGMGSVVGGSGNSPSCGSANSVSLLAGTFPKSFSRLVSV